MLSDETERRIREMAEKVKDVMQIFQCDEMKAWNILACSQAEKVRIVAEGIDKRQKQWMQAETRSLSARASTFKANTEG